MSTALQEYLGQFYVTDDIDDFVVNDGTGAQAVELTAGYRFIRGYTGESTDQLIEDWTTKVQALTGTFATAEATYSTTTGLITLTFSTTTAVTWTDTDLRDLMGFTADLSGASSYVATNQPRYVWRPSLGLSEYPVDIDRWWSEESTTVVHGSDDGTLHTVEGHLLYRGSYGYQLLDKSEVLIDGDTVWEAFEQFFIDAIHPGLPIRCYPDRSVNTVSDYSEALFSPRKNKQIGSFSDYISYARRNYEGLLGVSFRLAKAV